MATIFDASLTNFLTKLYRELSKERLRNSTSGSDYCVMTVSLDQHPPTCNSLQDATVGVLQDQ